MPTTVHRLTVRQLALLDLTPRDLLAWSALEARAAEPNAFLSPHFILPALRHLDPGLRPIVLVVERPSGSGSDMVALGVFTSVAASRVCPLPHLVGYCSRHSFLGGLLVDGDHVREVVAALHSHARGRGVGWQVLVLPKLHAGGPLASMLEEQALGSGFAVHRTGAQERAILVPGTAGDDALRTALGKRIKELERCKRRLMEGGEVSWHCLRQQQVDERAVETFLHLEHQGWKAQVKSSLRANPAEEAFFKEVVRGFAGDSRALFTELRVDGRAVASTSNFVSGGVGFSFKIGWEAKLRKYGPGLLNEVEFVRAAPEVCADLAWFDSGAHPDSFINHLWTERRELATMAVPLTALGDVTLRWSARVRRIARRLRSASGDQ